MHTTRWQQIEALFHDMADLPPGPGRDAVLAERCGDDAGMLTEVRALLEQDVALEGARGDGDPHLGLRLGSYEITRRIARGGMATVYEARRADDQFQQRVAIKVMDLRLSDPDLAARFRAERQILAALEHPALTRLLDGGVTALGEPYLVMEFVEGEPIDRYCDTRRLDVGARLRLFAEVCDGVAFAHRNLVLHRDLKPSNILVTREGRAKVVDFGTATLLQPDRLATTSRAPLTPAYASPEQLTGGAVGTASDQFSLGLVLYELLTGAPAFGQRASLMAAMERALAATTITTPHTAVTDSAAQARHTSLARLRRTLRGDLATILGKALDHEPAARYASVQHLADDLARWNEGTPILGRTPSLAYQMSRFVRRHWVSTSIAATLVVAVLAVTMISIEQARVARAESGKARQLNRFLTQMLSSANPSWYNANAGQAGTITVRQVLDGAGALIATDLAAAPEVEAEMRRTLGRTYIGLGAGEAAAVHLDRALALYQQQGDDFGVAFTRMLLGERMLLKGEFAAAEVLQRQSVAYVRSRGAAADPELHLIALNDLSVAISYQRPDDPEGPALLREAIAFADRNGANPAGTSVVVANLGFQLLRTGRGDEARGILDDALRRMAALPAPPPERNAVYSNLSNLLRSRGQVAEAVRYGELAVKGAAQFWPGDHPNRAAMLSTWGRALVDDGQLERGREALQESLGIYRRTRPPGHIDLSGPLIGLGAAFRLDGRLDESERALREAQTITAAHPAQKERAAALGGELGLTLRARGQATEAAALLAASHTGYLAIYGAAHPLTVLAQARIDGADR